MPSICGPTEIAVLVCLPASLERNDAWIVIEALAYGGWRIPIMSAFVYTECGRKFFMQMRVS